MKGTFPAEFKLSYGYAVRQPFPTRALLLQEEDGAKWIVSTFVGSLEV